jgi:putative polyhydroxyalkanoate system protein
MRVSVPHRTSRAAAKEKVQQLGQQLLEEHGDRIEGLEQRWEGDRLLVSFRARGFGVRGTVEITDNEVIVEGNLPLVARPFESKIRATIQREGEKFFTA